MRLFRNYLIILLAGIIILSFFAARQMGGYPMQAGPAFNDAIDQTHRKALESLHPELVLLGDSLVQENVDADLLSNQIGQSVYPIAYPGSSSAVWYLVMKNNISVSAYKPRVVVILFRDNLLTAPGYRVDGKYLAAIESLAGSDDELVRQLSFVNEMNPLQRFADSYLPLYRSRNEIRSRFERLSNYVATRVFLRCNRPCVEASITSVFDRQNMEAQALGRSVEDSATDLYTARDLNFDSQLQLSYLPEIIRLARQDNIQLIFVRSKTLLFSAGFNQPPELNDYLNKLQAYLSNNGALYLDLSNSPEIQDQYFLDLVHMTAEGKPIYTQALATALRTVLHRP